MLQPPTTTAGPAGPRSVGRVLRPTAKALPGHARAHNRSMVLQHLFHSGPTSRADLARSTSLTRVTVSDLVAALMAEGLVEELGARAEGKVGKPASLVGMRTQEFHVVAVDLADDAWMRGAVMTLTGDVVARRSVALDGRVGDAAVIALEDLCRDLLAAADRPVIGVGIGSPGVIDSLGTVVEAPNRDWYDVPLAADLSAALDVPVHVANDANTAALGEFTLGGAGGSGLMVLTVGQGVGAGIVVDGALVQGHRHAAGELGHVTVVDDGVDGPAPLCACGRRGCLETVLAVPALRRRLAGLDPAAADVELAAVGRVLGVALAPVVSALNLSELRFSGPRDLLDGPLLRTAQATVQQRTMPVVGADLRLGMASLGEDVALCGAAVLVLSGQLGIT
ncbi:ROK family transcriptional regulator [uncultured Cellulomonas sp.]|uniref:ROK family transcriptional regulator n=1 Tax=uncultured Cellulomonas sp. TaxID=189682 RepID=UPI00262C7E96|nr:ROK family transcriptional regulator [uncultured Cellulomonas sp.]